MGNIDIGSIWKPLNPVIDDMPLAVCDPRSVQWKDLVPADVIGPGFNAEVYYLRPQSGHRWYWMSKQTAEQPLLFLSWDSHPPSDNLNCTPVLRYPSPNKINKSISLSTCFIS